jgi:hypothetical protein
MRRTWDSKIKPKDSISTSTLPPQRKTYGEKWVNFFLTVEKSDDVPQKKYLVIGESRFLKRNTRESKVHKSEWLEFYDGINARDNQGHSSNKFRPYRNSCDVFGSPSRLFLDILKHGTGETQHGHVQILNMVCFQN